MADFDINNKNIKISSLYHNNSSKIITDGKLCYSRTYSHMNYMKLDNENSESDFFKESIKEKKLGNFIFQKKIGEGTFGKVILAKDEITDEKVAIKILNKEMILKETNISKLEREINILKLLRHNNIVHLYNVIETNTYLYLIMEYLKGIELFNYINSKHYLSEMESCIFFQQIISGIEYLGKLKVVHRDIKPENLIILENGTIKLVDFGLSNIYFDNNLLSTACGSPCYAAPEMVKGQQYSGLSVDIWSSGVVLYAMLCGALPFEDEDNNKLYKKISEGKFEVPEFLSDKAIDFLHRILNVEPNKRYNIKQIKNHPWFNQLEPKINMSEGLLIKNVIVPIDKNIISIMVNKYLFNEEEIKINLILNEHNQITTTYYLILQKLIKEGKKTIGDMKSDIFVKYIHDPKNQLSYYNNDFNSIINERVFNKKSNIKIIEKKRIRQISESKNTKKHYLINYEAINNKINKDLDLRNSVIITNKNKIDYKLEKTSNKKHTITCISYSNKKNKNNLEETKINKKLLEEIYDKNSQKNLKNNNNLSLSFLKKENAKEIRKNILFHKSDKNINKFSIKSKNKKININSKKNNKENNNFINSDIQIKLKEKLKNIDLNTSYKFLFNKKLLYPKNKINIKYKTNSAFKRYINHYNIFNKEKKNSVKAESTIKLFSHRNHINKFINNQEISSDNYRIKVDKKKLCLNSSSNKSYVNKINNIDKNEKIIKYSKKIHKRNSKKKNKENSSLNSNCNIFENSSEMTSKRNKLNTIEEPFTIYKKIKIKKSPFSKHINDENIYFRKKFIIKKKSSNNTMFKDFSKNSLDASYKNNEKNNLSMRTCSYIYKKNQSIEIREDYNNKNNSKVIINKPDKLKINIINNFSNIDNTIKKQNRNINTIEPKKKFNELFNKKSEKKNISINNNFNIDNNNIINTSINNKNNLISIYNNLNNIIVNKITNKKQKNINNINAPFKRFKKENKIIKEPQLCITNINFYNYIHNVQPLQKVNKNNKCKYFIKKQEKIEKKEISSINKINQDIKTDNSKSKNYIPFDLNSILLINKERNLKKSMINIFKIKKINYKINNSNNGSGLKFICNKNNIRYEISILFKKEISDKNILVINSIKKQGNPNNYKSIINQIIKMIK